MIEETKYVKDSLLNDLKDNHFDDLIRWENLKLNGFKIHFIVDAYLIRNYCFPMGINPGDHARRDELSDDYINDEQYTLYHLFYLNDKNIKIILLDEYYQELNKMLAIAQKFVKSNYNNIEIADIAKDKSEIKHNFTKDVGSYLKQITGLNKLNHLLSNHRFILDVEDFKNEFHEQLFNKYKAVYTGYEEILGKLNPVFYQTMDSNKHTKRLSDSLAIARCIELNKEAYDKKELFLFCSDSKPIAKIFRENSDSGHSLYCSIRQYFALMLCQKYEGSKINPRNTIINLFNLKIVNNRINRIYKDSLLAEINNNTKLFTNYVSYRNELENIGSFLSINADSNSMEINGANEIDIMRSKIIEARNKFEEINELSSDWIEILRNLQIQASLNKAFLNFIKGLKNDNVNLHIKKGKDVIESKYQLIPIYLQIENQEQYKNIDYNLLLKNFANIILNYPDIQLDLEFIKESVMSLRQLRLSNTIDVQLVLLKLYVLLLIPSEDYQSNGLSNPETQNYIDNITPKQNDEYIYEVLKKTDISNCSDFVKIEFFYFAAWVCRRLEKYEECSEYIEKGIDANRADPRFFHCKSLLHYCLLVKNENFLSAKEKIIRVHEIISLANDSLYRYNIFFGKRYNNDITSYSFYLNKTREIFFNNLAYFHALLADYYFQLGTLSERHEYNRNISLARHKISELKQKKKENGLHEKLSEYASTEAYVELVESFTLSGEARIKKLDCALKEIQFAILQSKNLKEEEGRLKRYGFLLDKILLLMSTENR